MIIERTILIEDINLTNLVVEFVDGLDKYIAVQKYDNETMYLEVDETWSVADDTLLDNIISNHAKTEDLNYVIFDYLPNGDPGKDFRSVNYKVELLISLYPVKTFLGGFLTLVEYYADRNQTIKILDVDISYTVKEDADYPASKTVESRTTTRLWYRKNGKLDSKRSKVTTKYYDDITAVRYEGKRRRKNIVDLSGEDLVKLLMVTQTGFDQTAAENLALEFVGKHGQEVNDFEKFGGDLMIVTTENEADAQFIWLDNVIPATFNIGQGDIPIQGLVPKAVTGETIRKHMTDWFKGIK